MKMRYLSGRIYLDEELRTIKQPVFVHNILNQSFYVNSDGFMPPIHHCMPFDPVSGEISDIRIIAAYELCRGTKDTFFIKIKHPKFTTYIPSNV